MWGVVESASNLTPRGLQNIFSSSLDNYVVHSLDSFLLSNRQMQDASEFKYMLFVWNGKNTNALVKVRKRPPKPYFLPTLSRGNKQASPVKLRLGWAVATL